jgi:hypothetical protein
MAITPRDKQELDQIYSDYHQKFGGRLEREKYDFLRTKEIFQRCMDYAHREFGWTKKSL